MMNVQAFMGATILGLLGAAGLNGVGSFVSIKPNIEVHSIIHVKEGTLPFVIQDRTVTGSGGVLVSFWEAKVSRVDGPRLTVICEGRGGWPYQLGRVEAKLPFDDWVGETGCYEKLHDGDKLILSAEYTWGSGANETKRSEQFVVNKSVLP